MAPSSTRLPLNEKRREEEEGLIHTPTSRSKRQKCLKQGLAVLECFRAWAFANPRRLLLGTLTSSLLLAYILYKLLHHVPPPPSSWRAQCRLDFPTHYAVQRIRSPSRSLRSSRRSNPDRPDITHTLHPLTPSHPSWPYKGDEPPSLADAAGMAPVAILVGVFTMDKDSERRQLIRATYNFHPESRKAGTEGVKVLFVMGQPEPELAAKVALESELYGDILILDIKENMNEGKTHAYFAWAAQNAQVPACHYSTHVSHNSHSTSESLGDVMEKRSSSVICEGTRRPDYVMKADDDSFIVLSELERRLRIIPREKAYWGLLMYGDYLQFEERSEYMAGEGYALSMDLVKYVASSEYALAHIIGHEDQLVGDWLRSHPAAEGIIWVTERCWMYDHPKAGKLLSHGFMFPDVVQTIQDDTDYFLPPHLPINLIDTWSTVSPYNRPYRPPLRNLTIPQQIEALIEGSPMSMWHKHNRPFFSHPKSMNYHFTRAVGNLVQEVEKAWLGRTTRSERMKLANKLGSTVLVHKVRKDEWWMETALALLGQEDEGRF